MEALKWSSYAAAFCAACWLGSRRGVEAGASLILGSAAILAIVTLGHRVVGATRVFGLYEPLHAGTHWALSPLLNPNNLAGYMNLGALCGLGLLSGSKWFPRWLAGLIVCVLGAVTFLTGSRAGLVALTVGGLLFTVLRVRALSIERRRRAALAQVGVAAGVLAFGVALGVAGATKATWQELSDLGTMKIRLLAWAQPMLVDFPLTGVGRGAFETVFPAYRNGPGHVMYQYAENFPMQWCVEWGVPVALLALVGLGWAFRPTRRRRPVDAVGAGVVIGVFVTLLQNLVDLGLEVPAVSYATVVAIGFVYGRRRWGLVLAETRARGLTNPILAASIPLALLLGYVGTVLRGLHPAVLERDELHAAYARADFDGEGAQPHLLDRLRTATLRHPADPYFPLLAALVVQRSGHGSPLPFLSRALERDVWNGRAHLALAEVLFARHARNQALLELKLAAEREPALSRRTAELASSWADSERDLMRAVPSGPSGASVLVLLADRRPASDRLKLKLLQAAVETNPSAADAQSALARYLIDELLKSESGGCGEERRKRCLELAEAAVAHLSNAGQSVHALILRARLLAAEGRPGDGEAMLADGCSRYPRNQECFSERVRLAGLTGNEEAIVRAERSFLQAACVSSSACRSVAERLGDIRASRKQWAQALYLYSRAVDSEPTAELWLKVARAAANSAQVDSATVALRRAETLSANEPQLLEKIRAESKRLADARARLR
ncbi:MAG: O-antigen ligase family protein [Myxococcales bacterium]|nr:O-antigen ligase family protein [Myxococcales bacterium]